MSNLNISKNLTETSTPGIFKENKVSKNEAGFDGNLGLTSYQGVRTMYADVDLVEK